MFSREIAIVLGTNFKQLKSVVHPLSGAIMKERLRWLSSMNDRLPKICHLLANRLGLHGKQLRQCLGWEDVINKDLKEMGTSWEGVKREALNKLEMVY